MPKRIQIRIGSDPSNHVVIEHPLIAKQHLELFADSEENVFVTDLGSPQGTTLNGVPLKGYAQMRTGDELILGGKFKFNWEKYKFRANATTLPTEKIEPIKPPKREDSPKVPPPPPKPFTLENDKQKLGKPANLEASNKILILIFGAIFVILCLMYFIN